MGRRSRRRGHDGRLQSRALRAVEALLSQSIFDNAGHDLQLLMLYTRAAFYATEPSNAAAYAPVEACGAHEWSYIGRPRTR